ncbi:hypothetical protein D3C80_2097590 [compost metagenome]
MDMDVGQFLLIQLCTQAGTLFPDQFGSLPLFRFGCKHNQVYLMGILVNRADLGFIFELLGYISLFFFAQTCVCQ